MKTLSSQLKVQESGLNYPAATKNDYANTPAVDLSFNLIGSDKPDIYELNVAAIFVTQFATRAYYRFKVSDTTFLDCEGKIPTAQEITDMVEVSMVRLAKAFARDTTRRQISFPSGLDSAWTTGKILEVVQTQIDHHFNSF